MYVIIKCTYNATIKFLDCNYKSDNIILFLFFPFLLYSKYRCKIIHVQRITETRKVYMLKFGINLDQNHPRVINIILYCTDYTPQMQKNTAVNSDRPVHERISANRCRRSTSYYTLQFAFIFVVVRHSLVAPRHDANFSTHQKLFSWCSRARMHTYVYYISISMYMYRNDDIWNIASVSVSFAVRPIYLK